ncbi:unnamed protein product [Rotaria sp. Silwood1]|nr:unnamed protein product [Rotaria sp. Silwood1]CAF3696264.1 unnamed protein product [Rotaria sp. Silwood1]CAF4535142.1 unnamed protein product [Rotaria sp. Silwood1]CAF4853661.1 unnamed protein product [Rotaria sp. Silwood1]
METQPNGQVFHQPPTVPPSVGMSYVTPQAPLSYNNTSSNNQWSNYVNQPSNNKQWWQYVGPYNPYRTTYQDYGPPKNQSYPTSNIYYMPPNTYRQGLNMNVGSGNLSETMSYSTNSSMPYNSPRFPQYM